jgi:hypothetical protein
VGIDAVRKVFLYIGIVVGKEDVIMKKELIQYSMQIAMLKQLLSRKLITAEEYQAIKSKLMKDYGIFSDIMS